MTQPDIPRHAPMNDHRQILISAAPCDQFTPVGQEHCWHRHRMLYTRPRICSLLAQRALSDGVASTPLTVARGAWGEIGLDRNWLKQYPPGVPADIDPDRYASLRDIFEEACALHRH